MDSEMQQRNEKRQKEIQEGSEVTGETEGYDIKALTLIHDNRVYRINFYAIELEG